MSTFKKCIVIILPTQGETFSREDLILKQSLLKIVYHDKNPKKFFNPCHLYILSKEEIKEGDWCMSTNKNSKLHKPFQCNESQSFVNSKFLNSSDCNDICKIIATTDKLIIGWDYKNDIPSGDQYNSFVPKPSDSFVQKFIKEYNEGNVIEEVMVEYEIISGCLHGHEKCVHTNCPDGKHVLKVNSKDNTIAITKTKDSWTKSEIFEILLKYKEDIITKHKGQITNCVLTKWLNENI